MQYFKYLALLTLLAGCSPQSPESSFEDLMESEWAKIISDNPVYASSMGDLRFNRDWSDNSVSGIIQDYQHDQLVLDQLHAMDLNGLDELNRINYKLFKKQYENSVESFDYRA